MIVKCKLNLALGFSYVNFISPDKKTQINFSLYTLHAFNICVMLCESLAF